MDERPTGPTAHGVGGRWYWVVGGAVGGLAGSLLFLVVLWLADPTIVTEAIPAIYGLEPGMTGWWFHVGHGIILGVVFGFIVSREIVLGTLSADAESAIVGDLGLSARMSLAGMVYGLAIWAFLPLIVLPAWTTIAGAGTAAFPATAVESLLGHLLYGLLLGLLYALIVDVEPAAQATDAPFEEADPG